MEQVAGWIAPIATTVAAMMTASNLGSRVTGWGFVVFVVGSIAWTIVALVTGQGNLLWTNGFLTLVNLVGVWRWLGREARHEDGAKAAEARSAAADEPALFSLRGTQAGALRDAAGATIGQVVDAMAECATGQISYVMVSEGGTGGVGERLHAVPWTRLAPHDGGYRTDLTGAELAALPEAEPTRWPVRPPEA